MKALISIIIPIYNIEKYIEKCVFSVQNLHFKQIEIILINDGSTDNSGLIADLLSKTDDRIKVVHSKNHGVSHARNLGLKHVSTKWIYFLDGDDEVFKNAFDNINFDSNYGMILGDFCWSYVNEKQIHYSNNKPGIYNGHEMVLKYGQWNQKILMGSFLVNRNLVKENNITFNINSKYGEDVEFLYYCLLNSNKVSSLSNNFFHYAMHDESAISKISFKWFDNFFSKNRVLNYIKENFNQLDSQKKMFQGLVLPEALINTIELLCKKGVNINSIKKYIKENDLNKIIEKTNYNNFTTTELKSKIKLYLISPRIFWFRYHYDNEYYRLRVFASKLIRTKKINRN